MKAFIKIIFLLVLLVAIIVGGYLILKKPKDELETKLIEPLEVETESEQVHVDQKKEEKTVARISQNIVSGVPFVLQAPFANWSDPLFEDACEEAAVLMATGWIKEEAFNKQQSFDEIKKIAQIEDEILGEHIDASASDTAKILKEYSNHEGVQFFSDVSKMDMIEKIIAGNLVIVPTNGRKLGNPNYTAPGPITHMIVIVGYDGVRKEFVTNDSGTRKGEGYRYGEDVLFGAVRDYPTGNHYKKPIDESDPIKVMIVVSK